MAAATQEHSDGEIEEQLQRILAAECFQSTPQLSALLSYLIDRALAGRFEDLKAAAIAQAVFRRDESFDAQTDTIVRVEAGRLRRRLAQYYAGDGQDDPLLIEVPKGGYTPRFSEAPTPPGELAPTPTAAAQAEAASPEHHLTETETPLRKWRAGVALGLLLVLGLLFALLLQRPGGGEESVPAVRSRPFIMMMPMAHNDSAFENKVADRAIEAVISKLAKLNDVSVMSYSSTTQLAADELILSDLRQKRGVTHVLDGQVVIEQNEIRAQIHIVQTDTGEAIWSEIVDGKLSDLFDFEDKLANRIATALSVTLDPDQNERLYLRHSSNLEALDLFRYAIRAIYPPSKANIAATRELFQRVTQLDPDFAGGYAGLSLTYSYSVLFDISSSPAQDLEKATTYAEKAIAVDPSFGTGVAMLGIAQTLRGDTEQGLSYTRRAIGLEPGDPLPHQWLALSLIRSGRPLEGIAPIKEALRLDPRDPQMPYLCILGMLHFAAGENELAIAAFEQDQLRGIRRGPYVYAMQAAAYARLGDEEAARAMMPALNADLVTQQFPLEHWLGGMLTNEQRQQQIFSSLYRIGMLRPEQRNSLWEPQ